MNPRLGRLEQLGGVTAFRYDDGAARGMRGLLVRTATGLEVEVLPDRGLDIPRAYFRGTALAWQAPAGIVPSAVYAPAGDAFERAFFGGLVTTCGLTAFGPAGEDRWGRWGQHGRIDHVAAEDVSYRVVTLEGRKEIEVRGTMREASLFGAVLRLDRCWRIGLETSTIALYDRVVNEGGTTTPHMLLYHCNAGYPLLDDDTRLEIAQSEVRPRDDAARRGLPEWNRAGAPQGDFEEQVFIVEPVVDSAGYASARFVNPRLEGGRGLGLRIQWDASTLPALFTWRMLGVRQYVMSVEPANCPTIEGRIAAAERGTLPFLEPGESRSYHLRFEVV